MPTTKVFRNGNSQAVRIPAELAYGPIREATREQEGSLQDQLDKLIAAHAVALKVALVTNNERDFLAYPGLKIENWLND